MKNNLKTVEYVDCRAGGLSGLLGTHGYKAIELVEASRDTFGLASRVASAPILSLADTISQRWLEKSNNPYRDEIAATAKQLGVKGIYALNMCFEYGCTSAVYNVNSRPVLTRVLDWPFPKMGEHIVVAHQRGAAGDFYNITWPGISGMFTGLAPGKFAIAPNQAPMQKHQRGFVGDWWINRCATWNSTAIPPAHLLRQVFETARNFDEAKTMLSTTPIALPVIFILSGVSENEACVIERTENDFVIRDMADNRVCASNQFQSRFNDLGKGWRPREIDSPGRMNKACATKLAEIDDNFSWFQAPVANAHSRLVVQADAANNKLSVMGTHGVTPVTSIFRI